MEEDRTHADVACGEEAELEPHPEHGYSSPGVGSDTTEYAPEEEGDG